MAPIRRLLVANRGEIACRIFATCRRLGIETVAVYSDADANARHAREADHAVHIGGSRPQDSYLRADAILRAAAETNADAIHPGYGFLSEDANFAEQVTRSGAIWVGPGPKAMTTMADKVHARATAQAAGVPVVPGSVTSQGEPDEIAADAATIGYPVMVKAAGGGGGLGMTVVPGPDKLEAALRSAAEKAARFFASDSIYLEKYIESARHIEVQVLGLPSGEAYIVGDRDCTVQRRHQKVLEEAPAPGLSDEERARLHRWALTLAESVDYRGAGTVEMIMDLTDRSCYFLEMNTRLQVEHPVTELVTGMDLVEAQLDIASGVEPSLPTAAAASHAVEFRVYAEDPDRFIPGPGTLDVWREPDAPGVRVDSGFRQGDAVTPFYDPLLAKLCAHGSDREEALARLAKAGRNFHIEGTRHNVPLLHRILDDATFAENRHDTSLLSKRWP